MNTNSLEETNNVAKKWLADISGKADTSQGYIVGLSGNLGSGKTTFTQAIARELGVTEDVTSPTFVIQKTYAVKNPKYSQVFEKLIHIDLYRIEDPAELEVLGFSRLAHSPKTLVLIEWPEKARALLSENKKDSKNMQTIRFRFVDEKTREIVIF